MKTSPICYGEMEVCHGFERLRRERETNVEPMERETKMQSDGVKTSHIGHGETKTQSDGVKTSPLGHEETKM